MRVLYFIFSLINIHNVEPYFIQNKNKPICSNCKFFISNKNECSQFGDVNIITGEYSYEKASSVRNDEDKCGEYAIFFKTNYFKFITIPYYYILENKQFFSIIFACALPYILAYISVYILLAN